MSQLYDDDEMKIKLEKAPFKQKNITCVIFVATAMHILVCLYRVFTNYRLDTCYNTLHFGAIVKGLKCWPWLSETFLTFVLLLYGATENLV